MEALWNLEEKWKLSNQVATLLFVCTALAVIGLCSTTTILNKKKNRGDEETTLSNAVEAKCLESNPSEAPTRKLLMDYMRWSERSSNWGDSSQSETGSWRCSPTSSLLLGDDVELGRTSHDSVSPVWQRPILMGEKCELPRFSGLILYNERGQPLLPSNNKNSVVSATTLRDLF